MVERALPSVLFEHVHALGAGREVRAHAAAVVALLAKKRPHEVFALLRQTRSLSAWYSADPWSRDPFFAAAAVESVLTDADPQTQAHALRVLMAHRSGYIREASAHRLGVLPGAVATSGLLLAADDPVPEVSAAAEPALSSRPVGDLAELAHLISSSPPDQRRAAWRVATRRRLHSAAARRELSKVAREASGPEAEAAFFLLQEAPEQSPLCGFKDARSWRVRRAVAGAAARAADTKLCIELLSDERVAVRKAVAWQAAYLDGSSREEIMLEALTDSSMRVLRIASAYCRDLPATDARLAALLASPDLKSKCNGIRLASILGQDQAWPVLKSALESPFPAVRRAAYRGLGEARLITATHASALVNELDPGVLVLGVQCALKSGINWHLLVPAMQSSRFSGAPGAASVLATLPVWDASPHLLKAVCAGWPGAGDTLSRFMVRWHRRGRCGWLHPTEIQLAAIKQALHQHPKPVAPEAQKLHLAMTQLLERHRFAP